MTSLRTLPALALALALAGCGGRDDGDAAARAAAATSEAEAAAETAAAEAAADAAMQGPVWPRLPDGELPKIDMTRALSTNYMMVFDGSGSMLEVECSGRQRKIDVATSAVERFIAQVPDGANLGLVAFDRNGMDERAPLGPDRRAFARALDKVRAGDDTPLRSAITLAYGKLEQQAISQLGYGEYHLVVVTDGVPDPESEDPRGIVDTIVGESPVVVHTVGFCLDEDHALNQPGKTYYAAADSPEALQQELAQVLAEAPSFDADDFRD
jgi:Mg-chelatase subunit ChlD